MLLNPINQQSNWLSQSTTRLNLPDADVYYTPNFVEQPDALMRILLDSLHWKQRPVRVFNQTHRTPRMAAWCADDGGQYQYSGSGDPNQPWTPELWVLKQQLEQHCQQPFNGALLNHYRNGHDHMGWHSDDENSLGEQPVIASVSLGAIRTFQFKHKCSKQRVDIALENGSLLVMQGDTQTHWQHALPKRLRENEARLNVTFRLIEQQ